MKVVKNALFSKVYEVDCFQKEFLNATKETTAEAPPYPRYQKWLIGALEVLQELGRKALQLEKYEHLEMDGWDICSIRYPKSKLNLRVLYIYTEDDDILLLAVFKEKSKNDYTRNIRLAIQRLKILEG